MHISRSNRPCVLITIGDPAGIGPEVVLKALASRRVQPHASRISVIGDGFVISKLKKDLKLKIDIPLLDLSNVSRGRFRYGITHPSNGRASIEYVDKALEILSQGSSGALVTGPANKLSINRSGIIGFRGHTEYLAQKTSSKAVAMMFVGKDLKVTLVTRHVPLKDVSKSLSIKSIYSAILLTHISLKRFFGIRNPRIGVSSLNPHAGEDGLFGDEERKFIVPAIKAASKKLNRIIGPISPDIIFYKALNKEFDAVISMYHDQGLGPFKMLCFNNGVNLTLGLPFIRTSPDHGTAFDIAGKNIADPTSMIEAILLACRLVSKRCSPKAS